MDDYQSNVAGNSNSVETADVIIRSGICGQKIVYIPWNGKALEDAKVNGFMLNSSNWFREDKVPDVAESGR